MGFQRISRSQVRILPGAQTPRSEQHLTELGSRTERQPSTNRPLFCAPLRPHPRLRRDRRWIITRLWAYPTLAVCAVFAVVGWTQPELLEREFVDGQPVPRVVVEQ